MIRASRFDAIIHWLSQSMSPLVLWGVWDFDAPVDAQSLAQAAAQLPQRVPVLGCLYRPGFFRGAFVPNEAPNYVFEARTFLDREAALAAAEASVRLEIDPVKGPGYTVRSFSWPTGCKVLLAAHHDHVDGRGMVNVMTALAQGYTAARLHSCDQPQPLPQERSITPILRALRPIHYWRMLPALWQEFLVGAVVPHSAVVPLAMQGSPRSTPHVATPTHARIHLDRPSAERLQHAARARGVTLNDVLLSAYAVAARRWNEAAGIAPKGQLSVVFASDYRRHYAPGCRPIANASAVHRLVLPYCRLDGLHSGLAQIKPRIDRMKRRGMALDSLALLLHGFALPDGLVAGVIGPAIRYMVRVLRRSIALTNIGVIDESAGVFGDQVATACSILAPVAPAKALVAAATAYRGAIDLNFGFDALALEPRQAARFAELCSEAIAELDARGSR